VSCLEWLHIEGNIMDASTIVGIVATAAVIWLFIRPSKAARRERAARKTATPAGQVASEHFFHWPNLGEYDFEVVGESNYQTALKRLAGDHGTESADVEIVAELHLENSNPHDPKAVAVRVEGQTVGYLSREDARSFRRRLGQKGLGSATTTCGAHIVGGGTRRNGEKLSYGIRLDIKPFE
jgi:hypothetical protein